MALLAGGILGVFLRNILDGPHTTNHPQRGRSLAISMLGGLLLGALTGAAVSSTTGATGDGSAAALAAGLSGLLFTYCVFSSARYRTDQNRSPPRHHPPRHQRTGRIRRRDRRRRTGHDPRPLIHLIPTAASSGAFQPAPGFHRRTVRDDISGGSSTVSVAATGHR